MFISKQKLKYLTDRIEALEKRPIHPATYSVPVFDEKGNRVEIHFNSTWATVPKYSYPKFKDLTMKEVLDALGADKLRVIEYKAKEEIVKDKLAKK
jgi:hypothetical protein